MDGSVLLLGRVFLRSDRSSRYEKIFLSIIHFSHPSLSSFLQIVGLHYIRELHLLSTAKIHFRWQYLVHMYILVELIIPFVAADHLNGKTFRIWITDEPN